jgi:hypothetical protein
MTRNFWTWTALLALVLAVASGLVYANSHGPAYICPLTGEQLPCARCCPLNQAQQPDEGAYICPLTGEELPCAKCCPLNQDQ